ncbi:MAG TPA: putative zinc-binding metallopeptidase [Terriglobales bacterium]|nr:putative zinc-binding metallopeptidase [Terriglobales bacterium]
MHDIVNAKPEPAYQELLSRPIRELGLTLAGSPVERFVEQLYRELDAKGLTKFRPEVYLTDEWGCPSGEPIIGIPFYLAHAALAQLEKETHDLEDAREIMMYLRHEAGHAFTYAYKLHNRPEWKKIFGPFRRPYHDNYRPAPFSRDYVRHLPGWYAQKHPDEDFAETFAVWLTPRSNWRKRYRGWGAMEKLSYLNRLAPKLGKSDPPRRRGQADITVDDMETTVAEFYHQDGHRNGREEVAVTELTPDTDLRDLFSVSKRRKTALPAHEFLHQHRKAVIDKVAQWTGAQRPLIKALIDTIEKRAGELDLRTDKTRSAEHLAEVTAYATALVMTYVAKGKFIQP